MAPPLMIVRPNRSSVDPNADPYWSQVVIASHFDGTPGSSVIVDETGRTPTNYGCTLQVAGAKFGTTGLYLNGAARLAYANAAALDVAALNFTLDFWVNPLTVAPTYQVVFSKSAADPAASGPFVVQLNNNMMRFYAASFGAPAAWDIVSSLAMGTVSVGTHTMFSVSRVGPTIYLLRNGEVQNTVNIGATRLKQTFEPVLVGAITHSSGLVSYYNGYLDDLRFTVGAGRYAANFTLPTQTFPDA